MDATSPPGDRLKAWREGRELSQTKAGELVEVSAPTWCDWEQGNKAPKAKYRKALEMLTGIPEGAWSDDEELALLDRVRSRVGTPDSDEHAAAPSSATATAIDGTRTSQPHAA